MEKRLPIALLLSLLFIWWYSSRLRPPEQPVVAPPVGQAIGQAAPGFLSAPDPLLDTSGEPAPQGRILALPGEGYIARFDTRGAALVSLDLTGYRTEARGDVELPLLGRVDGVNGSFLLRDYHDRYGLATADWQEEVRTQPDGRLQFVFRHRTDDGLLFTRTVTDRGLAYQFELALDVAAEPGASAPGTLNLLLQGPRGLLREYADQTFLSLPPTAIAIVRRADGTAALTEWSKGSLKDGTARLLAQGEVLLGAGTMTNYFAALLAPEVGTWVHQISPSQVLDAPMLELEVESRRPTSEAQREALRRQLAVDYFDNAAADLQLASTTPQPGQSVNWNFIVFAGPKDRSLAERPGYGFAGPMIEHAYGSMAWINHGLLAIMQFFERLTGNWGFAIVLLTLVVRILLFPLSRAQQTSMMRYGETMKGLKPQLDALKEKYKGNTRKYNEEQMKLLREQGVRPPLGGCLLMFVQLPVWWALFQVLRSALELRHAPFVGWIEDLSRPDAMPLGIAGLATLNLLPILMAAAQVVQLRMQPPPADAAQAQTQRIMGTLMPAMMLFLLYSYPSGLSLYIFTSSVFGIAEYKLVRRYWPPGGPAAERATPAVVAPPKPVAGKPKPPKRGGSPAKAGRR